MQVKIIAEMACVPEKWMTETRFADALNAKIVEPDKITFTTEVSNLETAVDTLIYDIEDYFNDNDIDYMDIYKEDD